MGTRTLTELTDDLLYALDNRDAEFKADTDLHARAKRWVNQAYRHVCFPNVYKHQELEITEEITLVTDDVDYALPAPTTTQVSGWWTVTEVYHREAATDDVTEPGRRLTPQKYWRWRRVVNRSTGKPFKWARRKNTLYISHRPTATENGQLLIVDGRGKPTTLTDAQTTIIDDYWDEVIIAGAEFIAWSRLSRPDLAEAPRDEFARLINEAPDIERLEGETYGYELEVDNRSVI